MDEQQAPPIEFATRKRDADKLAAALLASAQEIRARIDHDVEQRHGQAFASVAQAAALEELDIIREIVELRQKQSTQHEGSS